jgi:hypothetical protein
MAQRRHSGGTAAAQRRHSGGAVAEQRRHSGGTAAAQRRSSGGTAAEQHIGCGVHICNRILCLEELICIVYEILLYRRVSMFNEINVQYRLETIVVLSIFKKGSTAWAKPLDYTIKQDCYCYTRIL